MVMCFPVCNPAIFLFHFFFIQGFLFLVKLRCCKNCISPKPFGTAMGKVPLQVLKELEHQARQNLCTISFAATFAKTASVNSTMEKCQDSLKSTVKKIKS